MTSLKNAKGRAPDDDEEEQLESCAFISDDGREMGNNLQCVVSKGASIYDIGVHRHPHSCHR